MIYHVLFVVSLGSLVLAAYLKHTGAYSSSIGAAALRKMLRRRIWKHGVPKYCNFHILARLRPGQMALLDHNRCEVCLEEVRKQSKVN